MPDFLAEYTAMAQRPGWKAYVWARVKEMAAQCPELWAHLPAQLTAAMLKEAGNADAQAPVPDKR